MDWGGNVIKFDLERFINEKIVINCETKEQTRNLYNILKSKCNLYDDARTNVEKWGYNKEKTCFRIERDVVYYYMFFSEKDTYINKDFKIVKFKDLMFEKGVGGMKTFKQFAKSNWEKQPNIDWSKVQIDTKVLCKDEDGWHRRYFAGVNDEGKPLVFYFGANSWTADNNTTSTFSNVVLFEGNEHLLKGGN